MADSLALIFNRMVRFAFLRYVRAKVLSQGGTPFGLRVSNHNAPGPMSRLTREIPDRGPSLIPLKYDDYLTSGLEIDVGPDMSNPVVFDLT